MIRKFPAFLLAIVVSVTLLLSGCAPRSHTVTFDPNGGTATTSSKSVTAGEQYGTMPTPIRDGYSFDGWYTKKSGGSKVTATTTVKSRSSETLYAHWTKKVVAPPPSSPSPSPSPPPTTAHGDIKGNISYNTGERIYHVPGCPHYDSTVINSKYGERWFYTEAEAQEAGWRHCRGY